MDMCYWRGPAGLLFPSKHVSKSSNIREFRSAIWGHLKPMWKYYTSGLLKPRWRIKKNEGGRRDAGGKGDLDDKNRRRLCFMNGSSPIHGARRIIRWIFSSHSTTWINLGITRLKSIDFPRTCYSLLKLAANEKYLLKMSTAILIIM